MSDTIMPPMGITKPANSIVEETLKDLTDGFDMFRDMLIKSPLIKQMKLLNDSLESNTDAVETNTEDTSSLPSGGGSTPKGDSFMSKLMEDFSSKFGAMTKKSNEHLGEVTKGALLGPLQLITNPLQEMTGFSMGGAFSGMVDKLKPKAFKGNPNRQKVLPDDPGSVYLGDIFLKLFGKKGKGDSDKGGLLGTFAATALGKVPIASILKGGAVAAIAAGLIWAAVDGVRGWLKAKDWGTSKIAGGIGGALGGMASGLKGAFKNMGKWALVGAGIGLVGGPVGVLTGGLIGAALGAVFGFIGGELIAKGLDKVGKFFKEAWDRVSEFYVRNFKLYISLFDKNLKGVLNYFKVAWDTIKNVGKSISGFFKKLGKNFVGFFKKLGKSISGLFGSLKDSIWGKIISFKDAIKNSISNTFINLKDKITSTMSTAFSLGKDFILDKLDFLSPIKDKIVNAFTTGIDFVKKFDVITPIIDSIKDAFGKAFGGIINFFGTLGLLFSKEGGLGTIDKFKGLTALATGNDEGFEKIRNKMNPEALKAFELEAYKATKGFDDGNVKQLKGEQDALAKQAIEAQNKANKLAEESMTTQKESLEVNKGIAKKETSVNVNVPKEKKQKLSLWEKLTRR